MEFKWFSMASVFFFYYIMVYTMHFMGWNEKEKLKACQYQYTLVRFRCHTCP